MDENLRRTPNLEEAFFLVTIAQHKIVVVGTF
jgi:hypothetical protein